MSSDLVLVTGITGFLAAHVANELLKENYRIRGTVRNLKDENRIKPIRDLAKNGKYQIEFVQADLLNANDWKNVVKDCSTVFHVASPFPESAPESDETILKPAIDGTLNVLKACIGTNIKRVILTSSGYAIFGQDYKENKTYNDQDWGNAETKDAYCKSKILAEKAAWDFVAEKKRKNENVFELVVINPTLIFGPVLNSSLGTSAKMVANVLEGKTEKVPEIYVPLCDVRDVARAHVKAAIVPEAADRRFIVATELPFVPMIEWVKFLHDHYASKGYKISTELLPINGPGKTTKIDGLLTAKILGVQYTNLKQTLIDTAESLIKGGFVKLI